MHTRSQTKKSTNAKHNIIKDIKEIEKEAKKTLTNATVKPLSVNKPKTKESSTSLIITASDEFSPPDKNQISCINSNNFLITTNPKKQDISVNTPNYMNPNFQIKSLFDKCIELEKIITLKDKLIQTLSSPKERNIQNDYQTIILKQELATAKAEAKNYETVISILENDKRILLNEISELKNTSYTRSNYYPQIPLSQHTKSPNKMYSMKSTNTGWSTVKHKHNNPIFSDTSSQLYEIECNNPFNVLNSKLNNPETKNILKPNKYEINSTTNKYNKNPPLTALHFKSDKAQIINSIKPKFTIMDDSQGKDIGLAFYKNKKKTKEQRRTPNNTKVNNYHWTNTPIVSLTFPLVHIEGDSHSRDLAGLVRQIVSKNTKVEGDCKPGAKLLYAVSERPPAPGSCSVIIAGTNDIADGQQHNLYQYLEHRITAKLKSAKVVVSTVPYRHDLPASHPIQLETALVNAYVEELCARYDGVELLDFNRITRESFTKQGMHLKPRRKYQLAELLVGCLKRVNSAPALTPSPSIADQPSPPQSTQRILPPAITVQRRTRRPLLETSPHAICELTQISATEPHILAPLDKIIDTVKSPATQEYYPNGSKNYVIQKQVKIS